MSNLDAQQWRMIIVALALCIAFLTTFLRWDKGWRSKKIRRRYLVCTLSGALCGVALLLPSLHIGPLEAFSGLFSAVGVVAFVLSIGYGITGLLADESPEGHDTQQ